MAIAASPFLSIAEDSDGRGRNATSPWRMPLSAWKDIAVLTWRESSDDNIGIVAAGVAFYGFLALVPLLGAIVLSYGLVAEPRTVVGHVQSLTGVMPADAAKLIGDMLLNVVQQSGGKKGLGIVVALAIALFGARNAAGSIITALNIAYEEKERRSFIVVNLLAIGMTVGAVVVALLALTAVAVLGFLQELIPNAPILVILGKIAAYVMLVLAAAAVVATLYRYGPSREKPRWTWITPGSIFTALTWLILTLGFGFYVSNFGSYDKTYGSLGAVIVLLTWMYLSSYVLLLGAELNSEVEHQTVRDTGAEPQQEPAVAAPPPHETGSEEAVESIPVPMGEESGGYPSAFLASRAANRAQRLGGMRKVGMLSSLLATTGLALLRTRGRAGAGTALLATAAGLSLLKRERAPAVLDADDEAKADSRP